MNRVQQMLQTHPRPPRGDMEALVACIEACFDCAQTCTACADACLGEEQLQMLVPCIRLNLDCADVCDTTGRLLSRQTEPDGSLLRAQVEAWRELMLRNMTKVVQMRDGYSGTPRNATPAAMYELLHKQFMEAR